MGETNARQGGMKSPAFVQERRYFMLTEIQKDLVTNLLETHRDEPLTAFVERARAAAWTYSSRYGGTPEPALAIGADPRAEVLLHFGLTQRQHVTSEHGVVTTSPIWIERESDDMPIANTLARLVQAGGETAAQADGQLTQRIALDALVEAWQTARSRLSRRYAAEDTITKPASMPYHIVYAMQSAIGVLWELHGDSITRTLPAHPLRMPVDATPRRAETENRVAVPCMAWAVMPPNQHSNTTNAPLLVYVSLLGHQKELQAVKAAIIDAKRGELTLPSRRSAPVVARRPAGKGVYHTFTEHLPKSEFYHLVIQLREELEPAMGCDFPHLVGADGRPDLPRLFRQLDIALRLPVAEEWMPQLWELATQLRLITPLESYGCTAYWVNASNDARWSRVIAACNGNPDAALECFGELEHIAAVEEIASEGDDDSDNDSDNA